MAVRGMGGGGVGGLASCRVEMGLCSTVLNCIVLYGIV